MPKSLSISLIILSIMLTIFLGVSTAHIHDTVATTNTISFDGQGKIVAKPDIAKLSFSIVTDGDSSKAAQDANSVKSKAVIGYLRKQGVTDADISTSGYTVNPKYDYKGGGSPTINGYQVSETIAVKIRDLGKVDAITSGIVAAGVNQVNQVQFVIDSPEALKDQARAKAIADAKAKAQSLEAQLGIRLGRIVNFTENGGGGPIYYGKAVPLGGMGGGTVPDLPQGENEITSNVTLTYQIK